MSEFTIKCRAEVSDDCYNGSPTERQFGEDLPMREDGTYDWMSDSIVCDACYIMLLPFTRSGMGEYNELATAIGHVHANLRVLRESENPRALYDEAEAAHNNAGMHTAMYRSSGALMQLAMAEIERRKSFS